MKAGTLAGMMAGGALGIAVGAGIMMMPQSKQMRKAIKQGAQGIGKTVSNLTK